MPGKGSTARKIEKRRAQREEELQARGESELPPSKLTKHDREPKVIPSLEELDHDSRVKAIKVCRAIYDVVAREGGVSPISSIARSHYVWLGRRDACFRDQSLLDMIGRHPDVFLFSGDPVQVSLQPNAQENLPSEEPDPLMDEARALLPPRIEAPADLATRLQAFRIEVIHALFECGVEGAHINDLGQFPQIQELKQKIPSSSSSNGNMLELLQRFPDNFKLEDKGNGQHRVALKSDCVDDMSGVEAAIAAALKGKGCAKAHKGKGCVMAPNLTMGKGWGKQDVWAKGDGWWKGKLGKMELLGQQDAWGTSIGWGKGKQDFSNFWI